MGEIFSLIMAAVLVIGIAEWAEKRDRKKGYHPEKYYMKDDYE